jgi:hypothetical protein
LTSNCAEEVVKLVDPDDVGVIDPVRQDTVVVVEVTSAKVLVTLCLSAMSTSSLECFVRTVDKQSPL